jgi:uncharacterized protein with HEPN domain
MKDDRLYLLHIRECLDRVARYASRGREIFFADTMVQDAILRNLQILAESATRLSEPLRKRHPQIDWRSIAGLHNVLVHSYLGLDLHQIWDIVERDLPPLRRSVETILRELPEK